MGNPGPDGRLVRPLSDPLPDPMRSPAALQAPGCRPASIAVPMEAWPRCLERLEAEFPAEDIHTWLKPLKAEQLADGSLL